MGWEIVGAIAAVVAAFGSVLGIGLAIFHHGRSGRRQRIASVVSEYVNLVTEPRVRDTGASAFIIAGAKDLRNDDEVREAVRRIVERLGEARHPLGGYRDDLPEGADLKKDVVDHLNADRDNLREIVEDLR